jgi:hypothetical protein
MARASSDARRGQGRRRPEVDRTAPRGPDGLSSIGATWDPEQIDELDQPQGGLAPGDDGVLQGQ